jgi:hypothetical protein
MAGITEIVPEPTEIVNPCSECGFEIQPKEYTIKNRDPIANCLLRLCAIISGTWNDILASIQSISFLRETALYIDCTILAIWKRKKPAETKKSLSSINDVQIKKFGWLVSNQSPTRP